MLENDFSSEETSRIIQTIDKIYDLQDLSARPVLLDMICESRSVLSRTSDSINAAQLYEAYAQEWLKRELREGRLTLEPEEVLRIVEEIAFLMLKMETLYLDSTEVQSLISKFANSLGDKANIVNIERQLITSAFLRRRGNDIWEFVHRSFQEFFYGRKFFRWEQETGGAGIYPVTHIAPWQYIAQIALWRWDKAKSLEWIPERVPRANDPTLSETTLRAAAAYFLLVKERDDPTKYPLEGIMLDWVDLKSVNLATCNLSHADFSCSDLTGANFRGANLRDTNFSGASLHNTDLRGACLEFATLASASLRGAKISNAIITQADLRGIDCDNETWQQLRRCKGADTAIFDDDAETRT